MAEQTIEHRLTKLEMVAESQVKIQERQTATIDKLTDAVADVKGLRVEIASIASHLRALETEIDQYRDRSDKCFTEQDQRIDGHEKRVTHLETLLGIARWGGAIMWLMAGALGAALMFLIENWDKLAR